MKKIFLLIVACVFFSGCDDEGFNNNNPYIPNVGFSITIDTNLPQFSSLNFPVKSVYIPNQSGGIRGIILFYTGTGFNAFDAACPNQPLSSCSTMTTNQAETATCPCDDRTYNLFTGEGGEGLEYPMKRYRTEVNGTFVRIYN